MGCVASRIDKEERVRMCKERKRLMKQLLRYRKEFADAQIAYLRSLRNSGVTLRQFTEPESLEFEETNSAAGFPPSPPPPLPPSPPPPPTFGPDLRKFESKSGEAQSAVEEIIEVDEESGHTPPPPVPSSSWEYWDVFGSASVHCEKRSETVEQGEEENWKDTNTEFIEEDEEEAAFAVDDNDTDMLPPPEQQDTEFVDDSSSMMSWHTKDTADMAMVVWRGKKSLTGVVKDLDEYFLKASAVVKDIAVFIDINAGGTFLYQSINESKRKRSNSAKVFSALNWSWSSKSLQCNRETGDMLGSGEPCKPGAHCITLEKLYSEEQKLYKDVKEEEISKVEYGRKSLLLQKQDEEHDWTKAEKTRSTFESLQSYISSLQESIGRSSSTILTLVNKELHPQLITLASGLMHMWRTMYNSHQVQNHISQQLNHLTDQQTVEPTTESQRQAAGQLQTEVTSWHHSFCKLVKYQREYVRTLCKWTELTNYIEGSDTRQSESPTLHTLLDKWQQALDKLPDKMVSDAIRGLQSVVHSIILQQQHECDLRKRSEKLVRKLERELTFLAELEMKFAGSISIEDTKHPLIVRRAKAEALKSLAEDEKAKYSSSVKTTRVMILSNLKTSLPKLFQALVVYSSAYCHSFEAILSYTTMSESDDMQTTASEF
ncbi:protein ALTERED PHOSPHATE STARVATION RESPONSE 1 [Salvia miltiorrhiza]|uniref:protein ALTERED PHOSPHATE STARVATION RESPONSE 1 n=1 Tax=Salvia miltiorrhiza TaxID=226208 RepID=UPI0025ACFAE7|nr:protein ALTERED PHOSPHATE STARVATION RESPONSE 1 [Salvia miltiorrhiza]